MKVAFSIMIRTVRRAWATEPIEGTIPLNRVHAILSVRDIEHRRRLAFPSIPALTQIPSSPKETPPTFALGALRDLAVDVAFSARSRVRSDSRRDQWIPAVRVATSDEVEASGMGAPESEKRDRMRMISTEGVTVEYLCFRCGRQGTMVVSSPVDTEAAFPSSEVTCPGCGTAVVGRPVWK